VKSERVKYLALCKSDPKRTSKVLEYKLVLRLSEKVILSSDNFSDFARAEIASLRSGFLEIWLFSSQSELFESFLNCSDWLEKAIPPKVTSFLGI